MKEKIIYILITIWGVIACEDNDFEQIISATDDYTSETGGDYYEGGGIDVSHYDRARIFPGLVDTLTEKRIDEASVDIDMTYRVVAAANVNLSITSPAIYSTGLYAGAGEKITILLDDDVKGLSVQIGSQSRDLSSLSGVSYLERDSKIVTSMPLFKGKNEIRNPYGGYIWIKRSGEASSGVVPLRIQGAYAAPDYKLGETDAAEWIEKIKATTVPWIELRGKQIVFSVPVQYMKLKVQSDGQSYVNRLEEALALWDDWVLCYHEFYGLDGAEPETFPRPDFPVRAVMDAHLLTERYSYISDTNIELLRTEELIDMIADPDQIKMSAQNTAHVIGWMQQKMFDQTYWPSEALESFKDMYRLIPNFYFLQKHGWGNNGQSHTLSSYTLSGADRTVINTTQYNLDADVFDNLISWAKADSCKLYSIEAKSFSQNKKDYWPAALSIYSAILNYKQEGTGKDGWKFFAYLNRFLMDQSQNVSIFYRLSMHEAMITCLTSYFERDFTPLFDHWGIEISDAKRIEALEYRPVEKKVWEYNPLEDNETADFDGKVFYTQSGRIPFRHLRREWTAAAYSGEGENLKASNYSFVYSNKVKKYDTPYNLFDGDRQTLWSSYSDPYGEYTDENGDKHYPYKIDNLYYNATTPEFPYFIVVQPGEQAIDMDGVYLALGNTEVSGIYNGDVKDYDKFAFRPQHIIVEVTNTPLEYNDVDTLYTNIQSIAWKKVYDSDDDPKGTDLQQFWPDRSNLFYIELKQKETNVTGIRLTMDRDSHVAKDRPADFPVEEKPNRPEFTNKNLNRIQKIAEFGTFYFND